MMRMPPSFHSRLAAAALAAAILVPSAARAVTIEIHTTDGFQEGFNDPTPASPVGGNPGTTRGAQRRNAFEYAAEAWARRLDGDVTVIVTASFDNLGGNSVSAVLGGAAPTTVHSNFPGAPFSSTWYVASLANQLYDDDQNDLVPSECPEDLVDAHCPEVVAQFNSAVDNQTVLGAVDFYYGLDGDNDGEIDFLNVALHEIAHGLGLLDLLNQANGALFLSQPDAYVRNLEDAFYSPKSLASMTNQQRFEAIRDNGRLVWSGDAVTDAAAFLESGTRGDGAVKIYAPAAYEDGSSTAHLDTTVFPNELMEPFSTNPPPRDLAITVAMLEDIGWEPVPVTACGDADENGGYTTTDALIVLKTAVEQLDCEQSVCDVNTSFSISSTDALLVLRFAVGQNVELRCPLA